MKEQNNRELGLSRTFNAPRELVFSMWTNPEHVVNWWGPTGFTTTIHAMDVRPGGAWDLTMHGPDGTDYKNKSIYATIEPPTLLVFDHISGPKYQMIVNFTENGHETKVDITMVFESAEQLEQVIKVFKADEGLKQNMEKLEKYISSINN